MDRKSLRALVHVTAILVVQRCTWHQNRGICKVNSENQGLDSVGLKESHLSQYAKKISWKGWCWNVYVPEQFGRLRRSKLLWAKNFKNYTLHLQKVVLEADITFQKCMVHFTQAGPKDINCFPGIEKGILLKKIKWEVQIIPIWVRNQ